MPFHGMFKMRQLPKAEYLLMKQLLAHYEIDDPSELFIIMLRLVYEIHHSTQKEQIIHVIDQWRSLKHESRVYEVP